MILLIGLLVSNLIITLVTTIAAFSTFNQLNYYSCEISVGCTLIVSFVIALILPLIFRFLGKITWFGFIVVFLGGLFPWIFIIFLAGFVLPSL